MPPKYDKKRKTERAAQKSTSAGKANVDPSAADATEAPAGPSDTVADETAGAPPVTVADAATRDTPVDADDEMVDLDAQDKPAVLLDLSGGIPWGDDSLDLATRVSRFDAWQYAYRQNQNKWKEDGKPACECGKKHAPPCIPQATFRRAWDLGRSLKKDLEAQTAQSSTDGAQHAAQKETQKNQADKANKSEADKAKDSKPKTVCNRVCTHCGNKHFLVKNFPNGCKVPPCKACGKGHSTGSCAELRERFIQRGIVYNGAHSVANTNASHGFVQQPLEEVMERAVQIVNSAPPQYRDLMTTLAQRSVQHAADGAQTGHMTLPDRTKRSMNDDDDSDGGRPVGKKSKRTNPYGRR